MTEKKNNRLKVIAKRLAVYLLIFYFLLCLAIYFKQSEIVFVPTQGTPFATPANNGMHFEDLSLKSGEYDINAWYVPAPANRGTVLFCHGNAGNIGDRMDQIRIWNLLGMNVMIFDYRGYGLSQGRPTENGCYEDVKACYDWLKNNKKNNGPFIIHGRSLGGGIASWAAENFKADGLILESTFTSIPAMGQHKFPFLPIGIISNIYFPTVERISRITCPIKIFHGKEDELIPFSMGQELAKAAGVELQLLKGDHNYGFTLTWNYSEKLNEFVDALKQ